MSLGLQLLTLCAVATAGSVALFAVRGLPSLPEPAPEIAGACHAPESEFVDSNPEVRWIDQQSAHALVGDPGVAFVDCRAREQFESGHVSGSTHLDMHRGDVPPALLQRLRGAATVITYCEASGGECRRSLDMASRLRDAGLPDVRVLEGGMPGWLDRGYPAESGTCQECEAAR